MKLSGKPMLKRRKTMKEIYKMIPLTMNGRALSHQKNAKTAAAFTMICGRGVTRYDVE